SDQGGDTLLRDGGAADAQVRGRAPQPRQCSRNRASWHTRWRTTTKPSRSTPASPTPTATWATP
ncbi:unnamed protein product, partial [Ectocarpus sp. 8 AP-2014]